MKKSKPPEQPPVDFKHNPFKSLKGLATKPSTSDNKTPAPSRPKKTEEKEEDAAALFFQAMDGAKRIEPESDPTAPASTQRAANKPVSVPPEDSSLFLQAMKKIGTSFKDAVPEHEEESQERRSSSSRMKQLKRGTIRVTEELDLHGYLRDEAITRLGHFISAAYARNQQAVLVITGKGINSPEGPVLQGAVASWLRERGKGMVAEFASAPRDLGGSGAFVVFLKKH
jgi:DNA-nicking Smr family endonuclease